jgi:hypothetical protein
VQYDSNTAHPIAKTDVRVRLGRLYLPLPVYADTYRPTLNPYGIFEQTIGQNDFSFDEKFTGVDVGVGSDYDSAGAHLFLSSSIGELVAHQRMGAVDLAAYRVNGHARVLNGDDAFWRQGFVATVTSRRLKWTSALQDGNDPNAGGAGHSVRSKGGFSEVQWLLNAGAMAVTRFDQTFGDAGVERSLTNALVFRVSQSSRLTLEDVLQGGKHSLYSGLLLAF